ncbi:hypothetical protein [Halobacterium sp. R2-5]|uniref:hypothetical protein n=1 Tax=Halobacterium sp. R2-5 TaxID=2715751 RepID=UPI0014233611|nr:hypothetical protein [Halobacterium sp. R2-5]NIB98372.1 hypothetical protein [Halobacterium sp. R2-5]
MHWLRAVAVGVSAAGLAGYVAGVAAPYPGRAFSITALIVGITLLSITTGGAAA